MHTLDFDPFSYIQIIRDIKLISICSYMCADSWSDQVFFSHNHAAFSKLFDMTPYIPKPY